MVTVFVIVGWIFSLCCHEFSHALVAYFGGDTSVRNKGYLTFNPLKYMDPFMSLVLPVIFLLVGGIALPGGAVWIDRSKLRSRTWDCMVSLAGPAANLVLALVMAVPFMLGLVDADTKEWFWPAWAFLAKLQVMCVLLNLLPIPPLDGFGAVAAYLPERFGRRLYALSWPCLIGVFVLFFYVPGASDLFRGAIESVLASLSIPVELADGRGMYRF